MGTCDILHNLLYFKENKRSSLSAAVNPDVQCKVLALMN